MLTSEQIRAARAMLRWEQKTLATASGVSLPTIKRLETQAGELTGHKPTVAALRQAFEVAGIVFIADLGQGAGVTLRRPVSSVREIETTIEVLEAKAARIPAPGPPSPETGMNVMQKAVVENELVRLRDTRKRLKQGRVRTEPDDT